MSAKKKEYSLNRNPLWFKAVLFVVFGCLCVLTFYPLWDVVVGSFMPLADYLTTPIKIFPKNFTLQAYESLFSRADVFQALKNSIFVTVVGTTAHMIILNMTAYVLSRKYFYGRSVVMKFIVFTMIFSGGLIPSYLNVKSLGLINTIWALILVPLVNAYYVVITRTYYGGLPDELEESAKIDGANDFTIFLRVYVPSAMPIIATMCLFIVVDRWNNYINNLYYTHTTKLDTLQMMLYRMLNNTDKTVADMGDNLVNDKSRRMAGIVISALPLVCVYPFLQKHFVKGVLIGSVKG